MFADSLGPEDEVTIEATCKTQAIARLLEPHVARVAGSNPQKTRAIADAKVKTGTVDAQALAQLFAAGYLSSVWDADPATQALLAGGDSRHPSATRAADACVCDRTEDTAKSS
jgi:transposase